MRAEPYPIAVTTLSELLLKETGIQNVAALELRNSCGFAFFVALFHDVRGLTVLLTHCVLQEEFQQTSIGRFDCFTTNSERPT
jgi:hypothetical protein